MIYLDYAATNPFTKYPCSKYGKFLNPNANYAYKERKLLDECENRVKAAIGAKDGHVLYFRCATDALEWLHSEGNKCMMAWAHSPYEHDAAVFGIESEPDELVGVDFYCHQLVNQLTGKIHNIKSVHDQLLQYNDVPFLICDCTAAIHHISLKAANVCQYADAVVTSGHKYGCPDIAFMWIDDRLFNWLGGSKDMRNQWGLKHGSISVGHVLALTDAVEWACDSEQIDANEWHYANLNARLDVEMDKAGIKHEWIGDDDDQIAAISAIRLNGLNADVLQRYLATKQIYIGIGHSSCAEDADYHALKAYGLTEQESSEVIRVSFGDETTERDIDEFINAVVEYREKFVR